MWLNSSIIQENQWHAPNSQSKSTFIYNNCILGKELSAGWDIPAFEFEPDFAFDWAYAWSGTEMEIRLAYYRAHCVRICCNISQSSMFHS